MLQLRLCDRRTGTVFIVATTHLKAKSGAKNEAIRQRQVRLMSRARLLTCNDARRFPVCSAYCPRRHTERRFQRRRPRSANAFTGVNVLL